MEGASFNEAKERLDEIALQVQSPDITMDEALSLYEEAVALGMRACEVSEEDLRSADLEHDDAEKASQSSLQGDAQESAHALEDAEDADEDGTAE